MNLIVTNQTLSLRLSFLSSARKELLTPHTHLKKAWHTDMTSRRFCESSLNSKDTWFTSLGITRKMGRESRSWKCARNTRSAARFLSLSKCFRSLNFKGFELFVTSPAGTTVMVFFIPRRVFKFAVLQFGAFSDVFLPFGLDFSRHFERSLQQSPHKYSEPENFFFREVRFCRAFFGLFLIPNEQKNIVWFQGTHAVPIHVTHETEGVWISQPPRKSEGDDHEPSFYPDSCIYDHEEDQHRKHAVSGGISSDLWLGRGHYFRPKLIIDFSIPFSVSSWVGLFLTRFRLKKWSRTLPRSTWRSGWWVTRN